MHVANPVYHCTVPGTEAYTSEYFQVIHPLNGSAVLKGVYTWMFAMAWGYGSHRGERPLRWGLHAEYTKVHQHRILDVRPAVRALISTARSP